LGGSLQIPFSVLGNWEKKLLNGGVLFMESRRGKLMGEEILEPSKGGIGW